MAANIRCIMRAKAPYGQGITKMKVKLTPEQSSTPSLMPETESVYLRRATEGTGELMELVGGTVVWNQICPLWSVGATATVNGVTRTVNADGSYTFTNTATANANLNYDSSAFKFTANHVYYLHGASGGSSNTYQNVVTGYNAYTRDDALFKPATDKTEHFRLVVTNGVTVNLTFSPYVTDLTQMLGPTIADYVYSLEQATAGSGIEWLKKYDLIDDQYHAYSAPTLQSVEATAHVTVGKNQLDPDEMAVQGSFQVQFYKNNNYKFRAGVTYYLCYFGEESPTLYFAKPVSGVYVTATTRTLTFTPENDCEGFVQFTRVSGINTDVTSFALFAGTNHGQYYPYVKHTTPLANITLRGIPMKDADGNLYYYGDTYEWDGTVNRRFAEVDLGSLNWSNYSASPHNRFGSLDLVNLAKRPTGNALANIRCAKYITDNSTNIYNHVTDKTIAVDQDNGRLYVYDTTYGTDAAAFKTAMSGVYLVYELIESAQTTESADPFTAVQTVEDGGTEEFTTSNGVPVGVKGRFAHAVPMEGVDSFTVTANDGTVHTYPVSLSEEIYRGYVDMLTGEAISEAACISEYNGETINSPWLSSLDVYSLGATPTRGAQVVYPITPEEVTATITGDPSELIGVVSATSTEGTVEWSELSEIGIKCIMKRKNPFQ